MGKRQTTAEEREKNAQRARDRRAAQKATRLEQEAAERVKAAELPKDDEQAPTDAAPQPEAQAAPAPPPPPQWRPPDNPRDPWPSEQAIAACTQSAEEAWMMARAGMKDTRYEKCIAPRDGQDPVQIFLRPTAAVMARTTMNPGPIQMLSLGLVMCFGPTFIGHMAELAKSGIDALRSRREAAGARVQDEPKTSAPQPPAPPPPKAPVGASVVPLERAAS